MSSNRRNGVEPLHRVLLTEWPESLLTELVPTADAVWLSNTTRCLRRQIRGVPMREIDVLVQDGLSPSDVQNDAEPLCVEAALKRGKFDGNERVRITIRRWNWAGTAHAFQPGTISAEVAADEGPHGAVTLALAGVAGASWSATFQRRRMTLEGYNHPQIVMWHWRRYFRHLGEEHADDVVAMADSWAPESDTLAGANREAARLLYRLSRDLGWTRLTLRERLRIWGEDGQDRPIWHRREAVDAARLAAGLGSPTGCGQHTLETARGWIRPEVEREVYEDAYQRVY